jgi:hypothetical protein
VTLPGRAILEIPQTVWPLQGTRVVIEVTVPV